MHQETIRTDNKDIFIYEANRLRKQNKSKWVFLSGFISNLPLKYKAFDTSIQLLEIDGISHNSTFDISVKEFKETLASAIDYHLNK